MKIPKKINVLGLTYDILEQEDLSDVAGDSGQTWLMKQKILLERKQCQEQKEATLFHEIIEAINSQLELELPHKTICALETGFYQVLKDNKFIN